MSRFLLAFWGTAISLQANGAMPRTPAIQRPETVTVVIPVYRARYLGDAVESVFAQSRAPDAVILVDDGSPDREALAQVMARWGTDRIRLFSQPNHGAGAARNLGVLNAASEFVAFLDADDMWLPDYLQTQLQVAAAHPECHVVYANALFVGSTPLAGRRFMDVCPSRGDL
jgi:glycosyltransferase involved in cell wall biosynthesis